MSGIWWYCGLNDGGDVIPKLISINAANFLGIVEDVLAELIRLYNGPVAQLL